MTYFTHKVFGVTCAISFLQFMSIPAQYSLVVIPLSYIGSTFPDAIDFMGSRSIMGGINQYKWNKLHRKSSHFWLLHIIILFPILFMIDRNFFELDSNLNLYVFFSLTGFIIGILSHIFADSLTISGVPLFSLNSKISFNLIKTKGFSELIFTFVISLFCVYMGYNYIEPFKEELIKLVLL